MTRRFRQALPMIATLAAALASARAGLAAEADAFPLSQVKLLDGRFADGLELNREFLLKHDPDRLLAPFLREAGLEPKAEIYGNWESQGLGGQSAGHYLSALAMTYAATGDGECKERLDYMVNELARAQEANGNGYVGGVPDSERVWNDVTDGDALDVHGFGLEGAWVPWYNLHKTFAGLRDAYRIAGNEQAKDVLVKFADWCDGIAAQLTDDQMANMLRCEHGGMNETLADVYAITGDEKYLQLARRFSDHIILDPLLEGRDDLTGKHANTQIPKVIGFDRIADLGDQQDWHEAAVAFWTNVVNERSVSIGGNSVGEHFHPTDDFSRMLEDRSGPETCNTYNMLRLTESLFADEPKAEYADYYERALFNHIRSSQHPETGGYVYFTPMRPRHYRVYSQAEEAFWCCVGSGFESHSKYGQFIYSHAGEDAVYVNLFIASELDWAEQGVTIRQETNFPEESRTTLTVGLDAAKSFTLKVRRPKWAGDGFAVSVNGQPADAQVGSDGYAAIEREWKDGDTVAVDLPMALAADALPDGSGYVSFRYGPIVLAADMGDDDVEGLFAGSGRMEHVANGPMRSLGTAPTLVFDGGTATDYVRPVEGEPLTFAIDPEVIKPAGDAIRLTPFAGLHGVRYEIYFPVATEQSYAARQERLAAAEQERLRLDAMTFDRVAPGEQQSEVEHNFRGQDTNAGAFDGRSLRDGTGWFSYEVKVPEAGGQLLLTLWGNDRGRRYDISVDGKVIEAFDHPGGPNEFVDYRFDLPESSFGKTVTLRFDARRGSMAGGIFDLRIVGENLDNEGDE